jgi:hypothetical protein
MIISRSPGELAGCADEYDARRETADAEVEDGVRVHRGLLESLAIACRYYALSSFLANGRAYEAPSPGTRSGSSGQRWAQCERAVVDLR